ncbi:MAG: smalltalk protein [Bacteroidales bacterium]|nr:smalltalk protein [Bacteroidales bacterium]
MVPGDDSKRNHWKFILQTLISILTAILTALGATSCMGLH